MGGMSDGTLSIRRRRPKPSEDIPSGSSLYPLNFSTVASSNIGRGQISSKARSQPIKDVDELRIENKRVRRLKEYDRFLKSFKYSAALDSVLRKV